MLKIMGKKYLQFYAENFCLSKPVTIMKKAPFTVCMLGNFSCICCQNLLFQKILSETLDLGMPNDLEQSGPEVIKLLLC